MLGRRWERATARTIVAPTLRMGEGTAIVVLQTLLHGRLNTIIAVGLVAAVVGAIGVDRRAIDK